MCAVLHIGRRRRVLRGHWPLVSYHAFERGASKRYLFADSSVYLARGQLQPKCCSNSNLAGDADRTAVRFDRQPAEGQAEADAVVPTLSLACDSRVFFKDAIEVLRWDARAGVRHLDDDARGWSVGAFD